MSKILWMTDIHLDFVSESNFELLMKRIKENDPDIIIISGDIANSNILVKTLESIASMLEKPIYYVLGNHDYYGSTIKTIRLRVKKLNKKNQYLKYLPLNGIVKLENDTCLIGHDSWYDGKNGCYIDSRVILSDFVRIQDFIGLDKMQKITAFENLAQEAADYFEKNTSKAFENYNNVIVVMHVSPFKESSWYGGKQSDDNWLPFFSCKTVGDVLIKLMKENPDKMMTVLCGHSHGKKEIKILHNLLVKAGSADYYYPTIQEIFEVY